MDFRFSYRIENTPKSFIREILKVVQDPTIISFAGGMPNPRFFPVKEMEEASRLVFEEDGTQALQYSATEGFPALREWIANRYAKGGVQVDPDQILLTTGSQQCLDLMGKVFLEKGDEVIMERPSYLGTIQALNLFEPRFLSVDLGQDGPDLNQVEEHLRTGRPKLFYTIPNFQNPSGLTYSQETRERLGELAQKYPNTLIIEDDPYGELRFHGEHHKPLFSYTGGRSIMLGSFSKIVAPGLRLGWMVAPREIIYRAVTAKQAADLHSSTFNQLLINKLLGMYDIDAHIAKIVERYGAQARAMCQAMEKGVPEEITFTRPDGGMFLWGTLPQGYSAMELFEMAIAEKVAFVPGAPFYIDGTGQDTFRLSFSNANEEVIEEGIGRLCGCMKKLLAR